MLSLVSISCPQNILRITYDSPLVLLLALGKSVLDDMMHHCTIGSFIFCVS